ncbi:NRDE family protein [Curtobacterium sp. Leaf261]|uniref:NRDE family protein n=1 Tax=Curtobacterium sp. Leaf261 TaxID=1736311 RepID=UPI0009E970DB|nr:NRDE family protein [Curtobacterium sp. Leaf261]
MCTVIVRVEPGAPWPVTLLALRDESPERPWDPPGAWWPELDPDVRGVHDRSAGGAWLAVSDRSRSLAVVLNRAEPVPEPAGGWTSRGVLPLDAVVSGTVPTAPPGSRSCNLVRADADGVTVTAWDGTGVVTTRLGPGVHMLTETAADDEDVPRIARWLHAFRAVAPPSDAPTADALEGFTGPPTTATDLEPDAAWTPWLDVLRQSTGLRPTDPAAIVRDTTGPAGRFATLSIVAAAVGPDGAVLRHARFGDPAHIRTAEDTAAGADDVTRIDAAGLVRHA